ncbi:hypothetical protein V8C86DRAFT_695822 [Haematococcus lacustris]
MEALQSAASSQLARWTGGASKSAEAPNIIRMHGAQVPVDWLVRSRQVPAETVMTREQQRETAVNRQKNRVREQYLAAAAAGVHLMMFAYNLTFWGIDGMPQDKYHPANPRLKMNIKAGQYGNIDGAQRIYYDNLAVLEGA